MNGPILSAASDTRVIHVPGMGKTGVVQDVPGMQIAETNYVPDIRICRYVVPGKST